MQKPPSTQGVEPKFEAWPLDFVILEKIPEKGMIGGVHWRGRQVKDLAEEVKDDVGSTVSTGSLASRLRAMKVAGFVQDFPASEGRIWARLEAGTSFLRQKETYLA